MTVIALLLEVGDKVPTSVPQIWVTAVVLGVVGFVAARWHWWAAIPFVALQAIGLWAVSGELNDPFVGPAMLHEGGPALPTHLCVAAGFAAGLAILGAALRKRAV